MSQPQDELLPPVLTASVHDVRYFAALLRGVNFINRATVTVNERGLTVSVEETRTLLGTAFIFSDLFDEYVYHPEPPHQTRRRSPKPRRQRKNKKPPNPSSSQTESESEEDNKKDGDYQDEETLDDEEGPPNAAFEIPLNTLLECLNIYGTAGSTAGIFSSSSSGGGGGLGGGGRGRARGNVQERRRQGGNKSSDEEGEDRRGPLDMYFGGGSEKMTGMRLSYPGGGYPLTLIIAEDASGPTTTCEITTFDPEPHLELNFDNSKTVLKIILKSSWLRDALSELDPSCDKLTFVGNPPTRLDQQAGDRSANRQAIAKQKPMLRIQATGTFGSTEMDYPNDREVLETFECTRNVSFSYRFGHISRALKALQSSTKTSLRIDEEGLLSLQFLMPTPKPLGGMTQAFIEFRCLALDNEF